MIGILCAVPEELAAVRARLGIADAPQAHGPTRIWRGEGLVLALAGIGKVNAAAAATLLLSAFGVTRLVFSGVAGGLDPALEVGSVLLADRLAIHDYGVVSAGRFTPTASGVIPIGAPPLTTLPPVAEPVAAVLRQLAEAVRPRLGHPIRLGGVVTADYFLNCGATRGELRERFGADAIDMESGAVAQVADAWDVPLFVIRTLSDLAGEESHTTYPQMAAMASANSAICVEALLELLSQAAPNDPQMIL